MNHPTNLDGLDVALVARQLANLRYDALKRFLDALNQAIIEDALKDEARGRVELSLHLQSAGVYVRQAALAIDRSWKICEPHMQPKPKTDIVHDSRDEAVRFAAALLFGGKE